MSGLVFWKYIKLGFMGRLDFFIDPIIIYFSAVQLHHQPQVDGNQVSMVPGIKKIIHSYTTSVWIPFLLVVFFLLIVSILVISGGLYVKSPLRLSTDLFIKLYACSLLGQLYVSFWHFFVKGTKTGTIQLSLLAVSLLLSFLSFFFLLLPFWRVFLGYEFSPFRLSAGL